jgi:hypothetical protein
MCHPLQASSRARGQPLPPPPRVWQRSLVTARLRVVPTAQRNRPPRSLLVSRVCGMDTREDSELERRSKGHGRRPATDSQSQRVGGPNEPQGAPRCSIARSSAARLETCASWPRVASAAASSGARAEGEERLGRLSRQERLSNGAGDGREEEGLQGDCGRDNHAV